MATRPCYRPLEKFVGYRTVESAPFAWAGGFAFSQKQKNVIALHEAVHEYRYTHDQIDDDEYIVDGVHRAVCLLQHQIAVGEVLVDGSVEPPVVPYRHHRAVRQDAREEHEHPDHSRHVDLTYPEDGERDEQRQETSAQVYHLAAQYRLLDASGSRHEAVADVRHRDKEEYHRKIDVKVLMPDQHVYECQNQRDNDCQIINNNWHTSLLLPLVVSVKQLRYPRHRLLC